MQNTVIIDLINSVINNKPLPEVQNWWELFHYARKHSLGSLLYYGVKDATNLPDGFQEKVRKCFTAQTAQQMSQDYIADKLFEELTKNSVKFMPMKGARIRALYPFPEMRTSCDVDVFYDQQKNDEVYRIMEGFGFKCEGTGYNHLEWRKGNLTVEMHYSLSEQNVTIKNYYSDVFARCATEDNVRYDFSNEDFYVYFFVHAAKHFTSGGFGIRTVLDIYMMKTKLEFDQEYLKTELEKLNLYKFARAIEKLALAWFGDGEIDEETKAVGDFVLNNSTYGKSEYLATIKGGGHKTKGKGIKFKFLLNTLFPPYKSMKNVYPILKKAPILLPFAWVYKWFDVLFRRKERFKVAVNNMQSIDNDRVTEVNKVFDITGLADHR
jgi:hypothetical protein